MWLVTGPFDGVEQGDTTTIKTKLLKPGKKYGLGRKDRPLVVNNKKISRDSCEFRVGVYQPDNMVDPLYIPTLEIVNNKDKTLTVKRQGDDVTCNPSASVTLEDGDRVTVIAGIFIEVRWQRMVCFVPPVRGMPSFPSEDCASIGITTLASPHELLTHHLTSKYEVMTPVMTSLLCAAQLVKPEWLQELLRLGTTPVEDDPFSLTALENSFVPPLETKYRPAFGSTLPSALRSFKHWEPNEERLNLLRGLRFILPAEGGEVDAELRELVVRGGAEYEGFNLKAGLAKWRQVIAKGKKRVEELKGACKGLVILVKDSVIQRAVEEEKWKEMVADAESLSAYVVQLETVLDAVVHVDASRIACPGSGSQASPSDSSPLPSFVPNTHPDEPSFPQGSDKQTSTDEVKRAVSPANGRHDSMIRSPSPPVVLEPEPTKPKRRPLVRRLPLILPVETDGSSAMNVDKPMSDAERVKPESTQAPKPPSGSRPPLKRRLGLPPEFQTAPPPAMPVVTVHDVVDEEPPHKKFKALFEASDPDKVLFEGSQAFEAAYDAVGTLGESVTQTGQSAAGAPPRHLPVVAEEEESSSGPSQRAKSVAFEEITPVEDVGLSSRAPVPQPRAKSKVPPSRQSSEPPRMTAKPKKGTDGGVDKDEAFLTAVASKKRGKKTEDEFDREFNKLRISKPDLQREDVEQPWTVLGDFDDIPNIRGNFMVVMDLDVFKHSNGLREVAANDARHSSFMNRPNFKKFKKKIDGFSRAPVELVVKEENDYGMGAGYWKDTVSAKDYTKDSQANENGTQRSKDKRSALAAMESDEEGAESQTLNSVKQPVRKRARAKDTKKLFMASDNDDDDDDAKDDAHLAIDFSQEALPEPSTPSARARATKRRRVVADDDSDDGATFKGFGKKRRAK